MRDVDGMVRWRVRVAPGEVTCLECGEVWSLSIWPGCPRCNSERAAGQPMRITATAPTISYLRPDEYEVR